MCKHVNTELHKTIMYNKWLNIYLCLFCISANLHSKAKCSFFNIDIFIVK